MPSIRKICKTSVRMCFSFIDNDMRLALVTETPQTRIYTHNKEKIMSFGALPVADI